MTTIGTVGAFHKMCHTGKSTAWEKAARELGIDIEGWEQTKNPTRWLVAINSEAIYLAQYLILSLQHPVYQVLLLVC